jgi:hypothetical protein
VLIFGILNYNVPPGCNWFALLPIGYANESHIFNPSISAEGGRSVFVARRDYVTSQGASWFGTEYRQDRWQAQIVLGTYNPSVGFQQAVLLRHDDFLPCLPPPTCSDNGTVALKVSTGPEDPRLFTFRGDNYVSVFSYDNLYANGTSPVTDGYGDYGSQSNLCVPSEDGLIGRMYIAKVATVQANPCILSSLAPVIQAGLTFSNYSIVKNWLAFTGYDGVSPDEQLFFVHQISPHFVVMQVMSMDDSAVYTEVAFNTTAPAEILRLDMNARGLSADYTLVQQSSGQTAYLTPNQLAYQQGDASDVGVDIIPGLAYDDTLSAVHGSVNPVLISGGFTPSGEDVYLSIFHTVSDDPDLNYAHYAFTMCGAAPFKISGISKRLTLTTKPTARSVSMCGGRPFAFVSGLALGDCTDPDSEGLTCLIMSYGVCDVESRVSEIKLAQFLNTFTTLQTCDD